MTNLTSKLAEPFDGSEVKWRVGSTTAKKDRGLALAYIDARIVMQRLDDVVGPENWQDEYVDSPSGRVFCKLSIKIGDEWVVKSDAAGDTNVEGMKGGVSDSFKRAAVKWGIGRYLYSLPSQWVDIEARGRSYAITAAAMAKLANGMTAKKRQMGKPPTQAGRKPAPQTAEDGRGANSPQAQQERESERPSAEPEAMTADERIVFNAAKNFVPTAVRTITRYEHSKAIKAVAKLLGHDTVPKDGTERVKLFRQIGEYAKMRDGDMDSEAAVDLIVNG